MTPIRLPKYLRWLPFVVVGLIAVAPLWIEGRSLYAQEITPDFPPNPAMGAGIGVSEVFPASRDQVQVSPYLASEIAAGGDDVAMLILLKDQPDLAALETAAANLPTISADFSPEAHRTARATFFYQELTSYALQSQADLRAWLDAQGIPYRAHYIINMIRVTGDAELFAALRQRTDIASLEADPQVDVMHSMGSGEMAGFGVSDTASVNKWSRVLRLPDTVNAPNTPYGVAATHAPDVWAMGFTGQGITVASQDTGVQWDHPALRPHYRGVSGSGASEVITHTYNWLDAIPDNGTFDQCAGSNGPCDDYGHGTHTVGTMVGETATMTYGVAPGAQWMGCRNMRNGVGSPESYTTCFEFFLAPYPPDGDPFTDGQPAMAPHVINNSWGCPPTEGCSTDSLRQVVETVRAAGLMVVASAGNNGVKGCSSVMDPIAIYDATFTVGAHDANGNLAPFSSLGPVTKDGSRRIKPDVTAPGVSILSTYRYSSTFTSSGTSMASPHVAGAVALLWSAAPWLLGNQTLTEQVLIKSATPVYSTLCGDNGAVGNISPNAAYGFGRLDAASAVEMALQPWEVSVIVVGRDGSPIGGAQVDWIDGRTGYTYTATTDVGGSAIISPTLAGNFTLQVLGNVGTVEIGNIALVNPGIAGDLQTLQSQTTQIRLLYDEAVVPYPSRHFMPGIFSFFSAPMAEKK